MRNCCIAQGKKEGTLCRSYIKLILKMHYNMQYMQANTVWFHLHESGIITFRVRKYIGGCQGPGFGGEEEEWGVGVWWQQSFSLGFGRWMVVRAAQQCECTWCHWTVQLNTVKIVCCVHVTFYYNKKKTLKII